MKDIEDEDRGQRITKEVDNNTTASLFFNWIHMNYFHR
jgi:hypothetical protein